MFEEPATSVHDNIRGHSTCRRRMHYAMTAEPVDEEETFDARSSVDNGMVVGRHLV
jgi:hypothetical protein